MLRHEKPMPHPKQTGRALWSQDEAIAFESARETIGHMIAICTALIAKEKDKENPDLKRVLTLENMQLSFGKERLALRLKDHQHIDYIEKEYGAKIQLYNKTGIWTI